MKPSANLNQATLEQLKEWWLKDWSSSSADYYGVDDIAFALSQFKPEGVSLLQKSLYDSNEARRRAALFHLAWPEFVDSQILQALEVAISSSSVELQLTALWGFMHLQDFKLERAFVRQLRQQSDQLLAAVAMVYESRAYPEETVSILRTALHSINPRERELACDEIGDHDISELAEEMAELRNDPDEHVCQAVESNSRFF